MSLGPPRPIVVVVEANIGAGKTTFLKMIRKRLGARNAQVVVIPEPVREWESRGFLQAMYDRTVSAGVFQMMVLVDLSTRLFQALSQSPPPALIILERSVWGNRHTFAELNLDGADKHVFDYAWQQLVGSPPLHELDVRFLYLRTNVETVIERINRRARTSETTVSKEYLEAVASSHETWLNAEQADTGRRVVHIDANQAELKVADDACVVLTEWAREASKRFDCDLRACERNALAYGRIHIEGVRALSHAASDAARRLEQFTGRDACACETRHRAVLRVLSMSSVAVGTVCLFYALARKR